VYPLRWICLSVVFFFISIFLFSEIPMTAFFWGLWSLLPLKGEEAVSNNKNNLKTNQVLKCSKKYIYIEYINYTPNKVLKKKETRITMGSTHRLGVF
jgi:hypothetical protein